MIPIIWRIKSLDDIWLSSLPVILILKFFSLLKLIHCVARTCSTSLVPIPKDNDASAPWVDVWESPHTKVIPGWVIPSSGPITWTIPWFIWFRSKYLILCFLQLFVKVSTWSFEILSLIPDVLFFVGTLWSDTAKIEFLFQIFLFSILSPSKACGEVTSCIRCRSI